MFLDMVTKQPDQKIAKKVMFGRIPRHFDKFSIHQFVIPRESVWEELEFLNRNAGGDRHTDYCSLPVGAPTFRPI
jgi:hypothetical protein